MMLSYRVGIWSRLLLAFSFIAGLTFLVGFISLLIFNSSETVVEELAETYIPEMVQITGLVKIGGEIVAVAPNILSSEDDRSRDEVRRDLDRLLEKLRKQLDELTITRAELEVSVLNLVVRLETNLKALQYSVQERSQLQDQLNRMLERMRWLYADLLGEIDPLKQDYAYNLDAEIERIIDAAKIHDSSISYFELQKNRDAKESIEKIRSNGVLLVSLMIQCAALDTIPQIESLAALAGDAIFTLKEDTEKLGNDVSAVSLRSVLDEIYTLAQGEESIFTVRTALVDNQVGGVRILQDNQRYVEQLDQVIAEIVTKAEEVSGAATDSSRMTFKRAKAILILMVLVSLVTVVAVMWFYVRGNIVARLSALSLSMRAIARGDLDHGVPEGGPDEIGRMAVALRKFRDTAEERRRIERELAQAGKLAALGQFSAGIAHELNQPLSAMRYYLHNADKLLELGKTDMHRENLGKIEELLERMAKMINHLKTFARLQPDKKGPVDVKECIDRALDLLGGKIEENGVTIHTFPDDAVQPVIADSTRLEQVFVNVLSNGIDAAAVGEGGEVEVRLSRDENNVAIVVSDNGGGITVNPPDTVFDPFFTTKEVGKGLGLGLSIAYNIVKGFGGKIVAENLETGGACFTITLPKQKKSP